MKLLLKLKFHPAIMVVEIQEINKENAEKPMPKFTALGQAMTSYDEDEGD